MKARRCTDCHEIRTIGPTGQCHQCEQRMRDRAASAVASSGVSKRWKDAKASGMSLLSFAEQERTTPRDSRRAGS